MHWIVIIAVGLWFFIGEPLKDVANLFWQEDAAPWETVDAFYYPSRSDLSDYLSHRGLTSVQECRDWVYSTAASRGDPNIVRGDYECGVEQIDSFGGLAVYRISVR